MAEWIWVFWGFEFLNRTYDKHDFDIIWANEIDEHAVRTYRHNLGNHIVHGDIWQHLDEIPTSADIIIGGFPCQDISINGKGAGISGSRSGLYKAMLSAVERVRPKIFVAENVKGLLMKHHRKDLETVLSDFRNLGYQVDYYLLNAADYGVPQTRERVIIVGRLPEIPEIQIEKTNTSNSYVTARQAIGDLVDKVEDEIANHIWSRAEKSPIKVVENWMPKGRATLLGQNAMETYSGITNYPAASPCVRRRTSNRFPTILFSRQNCVPQNGKLATPSLLF